MRAVTWTGKVAAALLLAAGLSWSALPASATTLACTNTQSATTAPYGCGGLQIATGYHGGVLDMSTAGVFDSAPVVVQPDSVQASAQDFTVFPLGGSVTDGPGGLGEYVAMVTPAGHVARFTVTVAGAATPGCVSATGSYVNAIPCAGDHFVTGAGDYCLSVAQFTGPNGKLRWWALLRLCASNGTFVYGSATSAGSVSFSLANRWQVWAPTTGAAGLKMVNVSLRNKFNSDYDLNITGSGGAGAQLQAYPDNTGGVANDQWDVLGCTPPITLLSTPYALC